MKYIKIYLLPLISLLVLAASLPASAADVLWKSGLNQYVKYADQDRSAGGSTPPNQQPINLQPTQVRDALETMQIWEKSLFKESKARPMFSSGQAEILGQYLAKGLSTARPDQDIVFALVRRNKGFLGIESLTYMAGRAFYANDRLNVIIGDFDRPPDKLQEAAYGSAGLTEVQYFFNTGHRASSSNFNTAIISTDGVTTHQGRPDWFMIDVPKAAAVYAAENQPQDQGGGGDQANNAAMQAEAAKLAEDRRELRLEMARMKKQMTEGDKGAKGESVEERLQKLKDLHDKKLITDAEYEAKRKQILNDI